MKLHVEGRMRQAKRSMHAVHRWSLFLSCISWVLTMSWKGRAEPPVAVVKPPHRDESDLSPNPSESARQAANGHRWSNDYVSPGFAYSWVNYRNSISKSGGGPELSYILYPDQWNAFGIGGFARYLTYGDITTGLQAVGGGGFLGMELGYTHRSSSNGYLGAHCLHVAPFFSLGIVYIALALTIPVSTIGDPPQTNLGHSWSTIVGVKLPIHWHGTQQNWAKGLFGGG